MLAPAPEKQRRLSCGVFRCRFCGIISPLLGTALCHHPKHISPLRQPSRDAKSGLAGSRPSISVARKQGELVRRYKWAAPGVPATVRLTAGRRFLFRTQPCVVVLVKLVLHLPGMLEFLPSPLQLGAGLVFFESFPGLLVGLRSLLTSGNRQRRNESV